MRQALRDARASKKLSQDAVAALAGIARPYYVQLESGIRDPSIRVAFRIGEILDADPRVLFADVLDQKTA